jgi:hypothetical protein
LIAFLLPFSSSCEAFYKRFLASLASLVDRHENDEAEDGEANNDENEIFDSNCLEEGGGKTAKETVITAELKWQNFLLDSLGLFDCVRKTSAIPSRSLL